MNKHQVQRVAAFVVFCVVALVVIARASHEAPASIGNIPYLGLIVWLATFGAIAGGIGLVWLLIKSARSSTQRRTRPAPYGRRGSRRRGR